MLKLLNIEPQGVPKSSNNKMQFQKQFPKKTKEPPQGGPRYVFSWFLEDLEFGFACSVFSFK